MKASKLLAILAKINSLFGDNKWNLDGVDVRNFRRWFSGDATTQPGCHAAKRVALNVWRRISQPQEHVLKKDVFAAVCEVVPDAPCESWTEQTFCAWFFKLAEQEREIANRPGPTTTLHIHFDISVRQQPRSSYIPVSAAGVLPLHIDDEVRILHRVTPSAFVYLLWLQSGGQLKRLRTWNRNDAFELGAGKAVQGGQHGVLEPTRLKVQGPAGVETMLLVASMAAVEDATWNHLPVALSSLFRATKRLQFDEARQFEFSRSNLSLAIPVHNVEIIEGDELDEFHSGLWAVLNSHAVLLQGVSLCNIGKKRSPNSAAIHRAKVAVGQRFSL